MKFANIQLSRFIWYRVLNMNTNCVYFNIVNKPINSFRALSFTSINIL